MRKKHLLSKIIIALILILIIIILIFTIFIKNQNNYYNPSSRVSYLKYTIEDAETVGWIQVQGTTIDYPVIRETNNAYTSGIDYLWQVNTYSAGENREAIYGHNILNVSSNPIINGEGHTRFEPLMAFVYYDFAKENLYINYTYDGEDHLYKIYAVTFVSTSDESGESFTDDNLIKSYIKKAKEESIYDYDVDVDSTDHLISLITCTRYFGLNGKTQFRVDAREVRKNENIDKYSVETNQNYDIIK
jgi:sortase B